MVSVPQIVTPDTFRRREEFDDAVSTEGEQCRLTPGRGKAGCPCRRSFVVCSRCLCHSHFRHKSAGLCEPKPTFLGIALLIAAAVVMPWLAKEKRRLSGATGSAALRADAAQSGLCAYLSLIA
jgi:hypothetical protein